ncbi:ABC transporter permease [Pseudofrankia sp. DC12]|uniref:ABC transporter permease n=1 Tax=Pseudofrankia sp. DC12 TaxID=683315 RepID=UPI0005F7D7A9|nr:ABC transporter permease [Pseudofrankia sp. DC12]
MSGTRDVDPAAPAEPTETDPVRPPGSARVLWLVVRREVTTRFRSRVFRVMTPLFVVALLLGIGADALFSGDGTTRATVGLLATDAPTAAALTATGKASGLDVHTVTITDPADGERQVRAGTLDAAITAADPSGLHVVVRHSLDDLPATVLTAVARQQALRTEISTLGGDPAQVEDAVNAAGIHVAVLEPTDPHASSRIGLGVITGILIYISLMIFGPAVAQGVIEEKSSRVVELLLATVGPWQLMAGKVVGIGAVALFQLALYAAIGVPFGLRTGVLNLPASIAASSALWSLLWFLLGFGLYALLFAAAGALVSRQEDAAGVTTPLVMMIIIPYVVGISILPGNPRSTLLAVLSVVPFTAPLIMPMLIAAGTAAGWQIALAVLLDVGGIAALVRVAGRVYAGAVRRAGSRVRLIEALRAR